MKKILIILFFFSLLYSIEIEGEAKINNSYLIQPDIFQIDSIKPIPYMFHQLEINLKDKKENYEYGASLLFRLWAKNAETSLLKLSNPSYKLKPHLWELYLNLYSFIFENIDVKIGKQRIAWGTADRLNPTDILNPYDLQNPFDFGEKIPSEAIVIDLYLPKEFTLEGVFLPKFVPPLLPEGEFPILENSQFPGIKDTIIYPSSKNPMFAGKIYGKFLKFNSSLSYFYGFDNFPIFKGIRVYHDTIIKALYFFPKIHMIGFDFAGEIKSVGIWGEIGYFIPRDTVIIIMPIPIPHEDTILSKPYVKSTFGFDYTFKNGIYINFQWNHGFFFERYNPSIPYSIHDYFVSKIEKKFFEEKLKIGIAGIYEIANWDFPKDNYGYSMIPEISYKPHDNIEINLGTINLHGKGQSLLGSWKNFDQFYLNLKVSF
ncbi:MAG: hypothetical protein ABIM62_04575 [candidate division WOR-3 bacterium]